MSIEYMNSEYMNNEYINMNEANIGGNEMVFSINSGGACSGGFNVNSIMMKAGISPITTLQSQSGGDNVSDLFGGNLVIPSWLLSYSTMNGGGNGGGNKSKDKHKHDDSDDECVDDKLYETLLDLVREPLHKLNNSNKVARTKRNKAQKSNRASTKRQKV
jgi:hypothetical protein